MLQDLAAEAWGITREPERGGRRIGRSTWWPRRFSPAAKRCRAGWAVHGTTGYNYLNDLNGLFIDTSQARQLRRAYAKLTGRIEPFDDVLYASKRLIIETAMASELTVLTHMLDRIAQSSRKSRDFTRDSLREVIAEVVACFPVYRTYVDEDGWTPEDRAVVERAIARARRRNPAMEASLFDFFREVMLPRDVDTGPLPNDRRGGYPPPTQEDARERLRFAMKLQQYTGPVQAKGLEDTAFYRYNVLLSINEVGGDPGRFGRSVAEFHEASLQRLRNWPLEMLTTATHDTKLGEDVRARINAISELSGEWTREVGRWMRLNRARRTLIDAEPAPDRNDEYRFYQALVGCWPVEVDGGHAGARGSRRAAAGIHAQGGARGQGAHQLADAEPAVRGGAEALRRARAHRRRRPAVPAGHARRCRSGSRAIGMLNSLSQVVVKLGSPGVPDFYQGTDLWDLSLVDPDNRRPVDFDRRQRLLDEVDRAAVGAGTGARRGGCRDARALARRAHQAADHRRRPAPAPREAGVVPRRATICRSRPTSPCRATPSRSRACTARTACSSWRRACARGCVGGDLRPPLGESWKTSRVLLPPPLAGRTFSHEIPAPRSGRRSPGIRPGSSSGRSSNTCRWASSGCADSTDSGSSKCNRRSGRSGEQRLRAAAETRVG